jgi:hypothetical protein
MTFTKLGEHALALQSSTLGSAMTQRRSIGTMMKQLEKCFFEFAPQASASGQIRPWQLPGGQSVSTSILTVKQTRRGEHSSPTIKQENAKRFTHHHSLGSKWRFRGARARARPSSSSQCSVGALFLSQRSLVSLGSFLFPKVSLAMASCRCCCWSRGYCPMNPNPEKLPFCFGSFFSQIAKLRMT